jgi:hypothetical protein
MKELPALSTCTATMRPAMGEQSTPGEGKGMDAMPLPEAEISGG